MANSFISIIIPVYNGSNTIGQCLRAIFESSYPNFECIVVDDHSSDNTLEIAESSGAKIIKLHKQKGAAYSRNRGAEAAQGDILLFIDADVEIYPDSLKKVVKAFSENPDISGLFGSYDDEPGSSNFFSQYKNLFHHYIHQTARRDASTFWTGFGAVKKDVFFDVGKFDEKCRMMEDIELGYKLKAKRYKIRLFKELVVKHLKHYSFLIMLKSDFFDRAIPWTLLMLRNRQFTSDLNLKRGYKLSALVVVLLIACIFLMLQSAWFMFAIPILFSIYLLLNYDFYKFFSKKKGLAFALKVVPFHALYYLYSTLGFLMGSCKYYLSK